VGPHSLCTHQIWCIYLDQKQRHAPKTNFGRKMPPSGGILTCGCKVTAPSFGDLHMCHCAKLQHDQTIGSKVIAIKVAQDGRCPPSRIFEKDIHGPFHTLLDPIFYADIKFRGDISIGRLECQRYTLKTKFRRRLFYFRLQGWCRMSFADLHTCHQAKFQPNWMISGQVIAI